MPVNRDRHVSFVAEWQRERGTPRFRSVPLSVNCVRKVRTYCRGQTSRTGAMRVRTSGVTRSRCRPGCTAPSCPKSASIWSSSGTSSRRRSRKGISTLSIICNLFEGYFHPVPHPPQGRCGTIVRDRLPSPSVGRSRCRACAGGSGRELSVRRRTSFPTRTYVTESRTPNSSTNDRRFGSTFADFLAAGPSAAYVCRRFGTTDGRAYGQAEAGRGRHGRKPPSGATERRARRPGTMRSSPEIAATSDNRKEINHKTN